VTYAAPALSRRVLTSWQQQQGGLAVTAAKKQYQAVNRTYQHVPDGVVTA